MFKIIPQTFILSEKKKLKSFFFSKKKISFFLDFNGFEIAGNIVLYLISLTRNFGFPKLEKYLSG